MSDCKVKMHQIRFLPDPLAVFKGPTSKGREGERGGGEGKGKIDKGEGESMDRQWLVTYRQAVKVAMATTNCTTSCY